MMTPIQNLHSAIGEIAYAVAIADGSIQSEEKQKFHEIVVAELSGKDYDFDISEIIFNIMNKDKVADTETSYNWAMKEIRMNSHYLYPELKQTFIKVIEEVAKAYPPVNAEEERLVERFKKDIEPLKGDPVYYETKRK